MSNDLAQLAALSGCPFFAAKVKEAAPTAPALTTTPASEIPVNHCADAAQMNALGSMSAAEFDRQMAAFRK